jgi:hypothetical protein
VCLADGLSRPQEEEEEKIPQDQIINSNNVDEDLDDFQDTYEIINPSENLIKLDMAYPY